MLKKLNEEKTPHKNMGVDGLGQPFKASIQMHFIRLGALFTLFYIYWSTL